MFHYLLFWHFAILMATIKRKIHQKAMSHNESKIYLAMLNMYFWNRHVTVPIRIQSNGKYCRVLMAILLCTF